MHSRKLPLLVVALALLCVGGRAAPQDLLKRATFVASTKDWWGCRFHCGVDIQWVSDHEVFHATFLGHYDPDRMGCEQRLTRVACLLDTRTRRDQRLPRATQALDSLDPECVDSSAISPDGKWFAWSYRWDKCLLVEVKGGRRYAYPEDDDGCYRSVLWMTDSRHWLEAFRVNGRVHHLVLHDVRKPDVARQLPIGGRGELLDDLAWASPEDDPIALRRTWRSKGGLPVVEVLSVSLRGSRSPKRLALVDVPGGRNYYTYAISPDGKRLAWAVEAATSKGRVRAELWVTDLRGGHRRRLGALPVSAPPDELRLELQWLPGAKRLSFVWNEMLYTVAAR